MRSLAPLEFNLPAEHYGWNTDVGDPPCEVVTFGSDISTPALEPTSMTRPSITNYDDAGE